MRQASRSLLAAALVAAFAAGPAAAQQARPNCPAGRTADGACVDAQLAQSVKSMTLMMAQPKFSYTAPSRLPQDDGSVLLRPDIRELGLLHSFSIRLP
jgi:hypothetical protein